MLHAPSQCCPPPTFVEWRSLRSGKGYSEGGAPVEAIRRCRRLGPVCRRRLRLGRSLRSLRSHGCLGCGCLRRSCWRILHICPRSDSNERTLPVSSDAKLLDLPRPRAIIATSRKRRTPPPARGGSRVWPRMAPSRACDTANAHVWPTRARTWQLRACTHNKHKQHTSTQAHTRLAAGVHGSTHRPQPWPPRQPSAAPQAPRVSRRGPPLG